jgi:hydrogenase maturation protease
VLADDGVGIHVAELLRAQQLPPGVFVEVAGTGGLAILDMIAGYQRLILIDAIDLGKTPGVILELTEDDLASLTPFRADSVHGADLGTALALGRKLGLSMPTEIRIVAIQIADASTFSDLCTAQVREAIREAGAKALALCRSPG